LLALLLLAIASQANAKDYTNTLGMKFVLIPAGTFVMGRTESTDSLRQAFPAFEASRIEQLTDELPAHPVEITKNFYLGQYEVTVGQFRKFLEVSGYVPESIRDQTGGYGYNKDYDPSKTVKKDAFEGRDPQYSWQNPGFVQTENDPSSVLFANADVKEHSKRTCDSKSAYFSRIIAVCAILLLPSLNLAIGSTLKRSYKA
jgi:formylglycine-generating enzyme required for sulfatase activity